VSHLLPLFDQEPRRVRRADPETSKAAARHIRVGTLRAAIWDALGANPEGLTSEELARVTGKSLVSISPRLRPMEQQGLLKQAGVRKNSSGDYAIVWRRNA